MILLDTSVLIEYFRAKDKRITTLYALFRQDERFVISAVTHYETLIGANETDIVFWNELLKEIKVLPFDMDCSIVAINIYKELKKQNKLIDMADMLIGSTSIAKGCPIATLNRKHFNRIEGIEFVN